MISLSLEEYKNDPNVLKQEYMSMPDLRIVTLPFKKDVVKNAENGLRFDMKSLFNLTDTKEFVNLNAVKSFLDVYFGKTMTSSKSIVDIVNSYDTRKNKVQLWFLPTGETDDLSMELKKQIENHVFGHRYYVHIQNGKQGLKEDYENHINNLIKTEKNKEIIILLGRQLSTAVSIKKADIVVLLNHNSSNDLLKQMTFRCMTDDGPEKKYGIVVDFDQQRVVRSVISLVRYIPGESTSSRIKRAINCCSIDDTVIDPRDSTAVYESLYTLWRNDPRYEFEDIIDRLSKLQHKELTKEDYKYLETKLNGVSTKTKTTIRETKEILDDDEKLNYDDEGDAKSIVSDTSSVNEEVKQVIDYLKELQSTIPNFMALLTYNSRECDLKTLLLEMKNNKELEDLFIQQSRCMWGYSVPKDFFMKCVYFLEKYYTEYERSEINSAIERIKEMLQECISLDKKKELLKLLMDSLTPKETEKKQFGEVFTPLELIEEMLDKLPSHVWSDPNLKWLDPAAGIGNFPVCIYYRLMDGLSKTFPNEQERKSHILKNMLFMSELNTKNVFVLKLLFNEENIYCGDSLKLDANQVWDVNQAIEWIKGIGDVNLHWVEEPTNPDDVLGHAAIAKAIAPVKVATGEHGMNRIIFKQMLQAKSFSFMQIDATRVAGVNENIANILMAAKFGVPVCPHAGGVGLCEMVQHLAMFDAVAVTGHHPDRVVEFVDHLHEHFVVPTDIQNAHYMPPLKPGAGSEMYAQSIADFTFPTGKEWINA